MAIKSMVYPAGSSDDDDRVECPIVINKPVYIHLFDKIKQARLIKSNSRYQLFIANLEDIFGDVIWTIEDEVIKWDEASSS